MSPGTAQVEADGFERGHDCQIFNNTVNLLKRLV